MAEALTNRIAYEAVSSDTRSELIWTCRCRGLWNCLQEGEGNFID
jgi:hypothetical protein